MNGPLILRGYSALLQRSIEIAAVGSTFIPGAIFSAENALWEAITAAPAMGAQIPAIMPHDHGPDLASSGGGASIPRGCIYHFDEGDATGHSIGFAGVSSFIAIPAQRAYTFPAFVSPGIDSDDDSVAGGGAKCFLEARILARSSNTGGEVRLTNKSRQASPLSSSALVPTTTIAWYTLADIPCLGGQWNEFDLEARQTTAVTNEITIYALSLHEIRDTSQPESAGSTVYSSITRP
jgi:hypothetical protein